MYKLVELFFTIIGLIFVLFLLNKILSFFGIEPSFYFLYLAWFSALAVFYIILPKEYYKF